MDCSCKFLQEIPSSHRQSQNRDSHRDKWWYIDSSSPGQFWLLCTAISPLFTGAPEISSTKTALLSRGTGSNGVQLGEPEGWPEGCDFGLVDRIGAIDAYKIQLVSFSPNTSSKSWFNKMGRWKRSHNLPQYFVDTTNETQQMKDKLPKNETNLNKSNKWNMVETYVLKFLL